MPVNEQFYNKSVKYFNARFDRHIKTEFFHRLYAPEMDSVFPVAPRRMFGYTAIAYMLSSDAARSLVALIHEKGGFVDPADATLTRLMDMVPIVYAPRPMLVHMPPVSKVGQLHSDDSDLWYNEDTVPGAPIIKRPQPWAAGCIKCNL
jgi:hypothetical protein